MGGLYDTLIGDINDRNYESPVFRHYLNDRIQGNFYRERDTRRIVAEPNDIVTDFIASMTDDYFIDICRYLHIDDEKMEQLRYHEYF